MSSDPNGPDNEQPNIELVKAIDNLIDEVKSKFVKVTGDISVKLDEMGERLDRLEAAITAGQNTAKHEEG